MKNIILTAVLAACIVALPISCTSLSGVTCPSTWDTATCRVNQAIAISERADLLMQAALASGLIPPPLSTIFAGYHAAVPTFVSLAQEGLAAYEADHTKDYVMACSALEDLFATLQKSLQAQGATDYVAQATTQVKTEGVESSIATLKLKGVIK
jgi:hypothetical protein